jgi:hypothetical protein
MTGRAIQSSTVFFGVAIESTEHYMIGSDTPQSQEIMIYVSRLTPEGWAVVLDGNIVCVLRTQREADKAAGDLAQRSANEDKQAETRLLKSNGRLRSIRKFGPR